MDDTEHLLTSQRDQLRRRMRRANTAVAVILLSVLALAVAAVLAGRRAAQDQRRAEEAESAGRERLWRAHLAEARAARLSGLMGRRDMALAAIRNAAALRTSPELRDEAIAAYALPDFLHETAVTELETNGALIEFAPGLELYAVGTADGPVSVCRAQDQAVLFRFDPATAGLKALAGHDRRVLDRQFSPDGRYFAMTFYDGALVVWELAQGRPVFLHAPKRSSFVYTEFSRDSGEFVFQDADRTNALSRIELATGRRLDWPVSGQVGPFSFRPGTNLVAIASNHIVRFMSPDTGEVARELVAPSGITWLLWSPDGRRLSATSDVHDLYLWDLDSGRLQVLTGHRDVCRALTFSPDGTLLLSASNDNVTYLWDTATGRQIVGATDRIGFEFSRDGRRAGFLVNRRRLVTCELETSGVFRGLSARGSRNQPITTLDLSPDGRWLAVLVTGGVQLWDLNVERSGQFIPIPDATTLALHPETASLLLGRAGRLEWRSIESDEKGIHLGSPRVVPLPPGVSIRQASLSLDGRTLCAELQDRRMMVIDVSGQRTNVLLKMRSVYFFAAGPGSSTGAGRFAVSPDGRWVVNAYGTPESSAPQVFDAHTGELAQMLDSGPGHATFSPDGRWLIVSGGETYSLWRVSDWTPVWRRRCEALFAWRGFAAFSRDNRRLALALDRHRVGLVSATSGETVAEFTTPWPESVSSLRMAHDETRLVTGTFNGLAQVWEIPPLRSRVATLGMDFEAPAPPAARVTESPGATASAGTAGMTAIGMALLGAGVATIFAFLTLSRQRRLTEEFVQAETRALRQGRELQVEREVNRLKSSFISTVSHEFRTPLGVIRSSGEILQTYFERLRPEQRREHLADIVQSSIRMKDLMEEVLLLGRVEAGKMECHIAPVDLPQLIRRAVNEITTASEGRCPIDLDLDGLDGVARLDERLVHIILTNLLSNGVKYSPAGRTVHCSARSEAGGVAIEIRDEGIGIPEADQADLFKSFHRASNVGDISGSGLGLTIVKRCVELHGGSISYVTAEGAGTTFTVLFPA